MTNLPFFSLLGGGLIIIFYCCYLIKKLNTTLLEEMFAKVENQRQFQVILENLEESIILVSEEKIEFLNVKFFYDFKNSLTEFISKSG